MVYQGVSSIRCYGLMQMTLYEKSLCNKLSYLIYNTYFVTSNGGYCNFELISSMMPDNFETFLIKQKSNTNRCRHQMAIILKYLVEDPMDMKGIM